ncbi:hypothetical protein ACHAW5_002828 [Stephanodiscus triporus]|uniref:Phosphatidic acid phosphatase type 2/haloperoxidase domain-containing protein n=1 Tax=Stephanodiscus triporus TaxID=2934178 RepID=A0ABD3PTJ6_9STRA
MVTAVAALTLSLVLSLQTNGADALAVAAPRLLSRLPDGGWRKNPRAAIVPPPSPRLFDRSPSKYTPSMTTSESESEDIPHKITTAVGKTASTVVSVSFFVVLAYRRDAVVLAIWIGSILNAVLSKVFKRLLDHERPAELMNNDGVGLKPSDGGMPSSHAMSLAFIGISILWGGVVPAECRPAAGLAVAIYSAVALRYRVRDHLHTADQVVVGLVLGATNALAWIRFGVAGVGDGNDAAGPVLSYVRGNWVSAETGLFPYSALAIPVVVGIIVVGSFERRIALWMKKDKKT